MGASGLAAAAVFAAVAAVLFATAPTALDFWWQDAPRHALNGAFVVDLVKAMPFADPMRWALEYYGRYPALTILFYPPAFYAIEAMFYAAFGVSHAVAQLAITPYTVLLGLSAYGIARSGMPFWTALGVGLMAVGTPLSLLWGRQVMLDIPAYALLLCAVWFLLRHLRGQATSDLLLSAVFLVATIYTKQTVIFIVPALLVGFVGALGPKALLRPQVLIVLALTALASVPMVYLTMRFGAVNVQSVQGRSIDASRFSAEAWSFYLRQLPDQLGWPVLILGVAGMLLLAMGKEGARFPRWQRAALLTWLVGGYAFFSLIGVREPRHDMMVLFPLLIGVAVALHASLPSRLAQLAVMLVAAGTLGWSVARQPVPVVSAFAAASELVTRQAPRDGIVLLSAYRDANFIYAMRTHTERPDISTVRSDKLLLDISVERSRGVGQSDMTEAEIAQTLRDLGVTMIVQQVGFWNDLREMARLEAVLNSPAFELQ
eukprot:gene5722-5785_t